MCITCDNDSTTECGICKKLVYCDNASCQSIGWSVHQCNVIDVLEPNMTAFTPFIGEEDHEEVDESIYQAYVLRYVDPKGSIQQRLVGGMASFEPRGPKLGRGPDKIDSMVRDASYRIVLELYRDAFVEEKQILTIDDGTMTIGDDSIWAGAPGMAGRLARNNLVRTFMNTGNSYVLWPNPGRIQAAIAKQGLNVPVTGGSIKLTAFVEGMQVSSIHGIYRFDHGNQFFKRTLRRLNPFQTEFKHKFKRGQMSDAALQNLEAIRATDNEGTAAQLTFEITRSRDGKQALTARLLDIEMQVPLRTVNDIVIQNITPTTETKSDNISEKTNFLCNPRDLDHVTGLVMAMEDKMAAGELHGALIQQQFDVISSYRETMEKDGSVALTPKVNAAIQGATQSLWQLVGRRNKAAFDQNYYDMHKNDSYAAISIEVDSLAVGEGNKIIRKLTGKRGKEKGRARAIQRIVNERMSEIENRLGRDAAMSDSMYKMYTTLLEKVAQVL